MSENPYQSPAADESRVIGVKSGNREDLRSVAKYQKGIIVCMLLYFLVVFSQFLAPLFPADVGTLVAVVVALGALAVILSGTVFVFLLAMKVYSTGVGVLLGILTLVPCIGLIVLLVVNGKATTILRQNGVRVGFLGADPSVI